MKFTSLVHTWYKVAYVLVVLVMAFGARRTLEAQGERLGSAEPSLLEFVITVVSDPYILAFATMIAWLTFTATTVSGKSESIVVIRYGSRARWLFSQALRAAREAWALVLVTSLAAVAAGAGLSWSWEWGQIATDPDSTAQILVAFAQTPLPPVAAWLLQSLLTPLAFTVLYVVVSVAAVFAVQRAALVLALLIVGEFIGVLLLVRTTTVGAASGLILAPDSRFLFWPLGPVAADLLVVVLIIAGVYVLEHRHRALHPRMNWAALVYVVIVVVSVGLSTRVDDAQSLADVLVSAFYGASRDGLEFTSYARCQLVFLGLTFLILHRAQSTDVPRLLLLAVRHGRLWPWARGILLRILLAGALLHVGLVSLAAVITFLTGGTLASPELGRVFVQFAVNGVLQVFVSTVIVVGVLIVTASDRIALATLAALVLVGLPQISAGWIPAGLNMLGHLGDPSFDPARAALLLGVTATALVLITYFATTNPASQRYLTGRIHAHH